MPGASMPDFYFIISAAAIVLAAIYSLILLAVLLMVISKKTVAPKSEASGILSVVIPFRNEGSDLFKRFAEVESSGLALKSRVIFVDDHSTDLHRDITAKELPPGAELLTLLAGLTGKKQAIAYAMQYAHTEWVLTNDTDANINPEILNYISGLSPEAKLYLLPVKPVSVPSIASKLFAIEFIILQAVGVAFAKMRKPILANGAGLIVNRKAFLDTKTRRTDWHLSGGDDIFTMLAIHKAFGSRSVDALITYKPLVEAAFPKSFAKLWQQRVRWVAKVPAVPNLRFGILSWFVLIINMLTIGVTANAALSGISSTAVVVLSLKWIPELALAAWGVLYFRRPDCAIWIIPALAVYPLYLLVLTVTAVFWTPRWK